MTLLIRRRGQMLFFGDDDDTTEDEDSDKSDDDAWDLIKKFDDGFDEHCNGDAADRILLESLDEESRQELLLERFEARQRMMEYHELKQKLQMEKAVSTGKLPKRKSWKQTPVGRRANTLKQSRTCVNNTADDGDVSAVVETKTGWICNRCTMSNTDNDLRW